MHSEPCHPQAGQRQQAQGLLLPGWDPPLPPPRHPSADSWSSINEAIGVLKLEGAERPFRPTVSSLQMKKLRPRGSKGWPPASTEGRCAPGLATVEMLGRGGGRARGRHLRCPQYTSREEASLLVTLAPQDLCGPPSQSPFLSPPFTGPQRGRTETEIPIQKTRNHLEMGSH